jgi:ATP-dependent Lhr-like helicase
MRVVNAEGAPPSLPFWLGEGPARTRELSAEISRLREERPTAADLAAPDGVPEAAAEQVSEYLELGATELGELPTQRCLVLERFFDETGGMQLVLHSPFGGRINRALGLALRKRFCVGFGFELQAAANEEAIVLSLGLQQSFPLDEVFDYLHPTTARKVLTKALLPAPMFQARWRWNVTRSLLVPRMRGGKRTPPPILRMMADDLMAQAFPDLAACPETLTGDIRIPMEHPVVRQTVEDCLNEAMDADGFLEVLEGLRDGSIRRVAVDRPEPSVLAQGILNSQVYTFLDDAPLEERRTQAVARRRILTPTSADSLGALDADAVARVREEAWPAPESAEEVHEALLWMGFVTAREAEPWSAWIDELASAGRVTLDPGRDGGRWFAVEATREPLAVLRGRMEALGPIESEDPLLVQLETEGCVLRARHEGKTLWCDRRLLARIHGYTLDRLRREIKPVTAAEFLRFLACWQHVDPGYRLDGPGGVAQVVRQLAGFDVPAAAWERHVLPARVRGYRPEWLDRLTLSGEIAWGRLWGGGASALRTTPLCLVPREDLETWESLAGLAAVDDLRAEAGEIREVLLRRGAAFVQELGRTTRLLPAQLDVGLSELVSHGAVTCDSFAGLRRLVIPRSRRRNTLSRTPSAGRWSLFRRDEIAGEISNDTVEFVARRLLGRTGVVFRRTLTREKIRVPWWRLLRALRRMELQGHVRGGRFVDRFAGEQYALPEAVRMLRDLRRGGERPAVSVSAGDPLNLRGILTPDERVPPATKREVLVG